jgi:hypothetical protein
VRLAIVKEIWGREWVVATLGAAFVARLMSTASVSTSVRSSRERQMALIKTLKAIRAKIRPEPVRDPLPPPPKQSAPPRATAKQRRRAGR